MVGDVEGHSSAQIPVINTLITNLITSRRRTKTTDTQDNLYSIT